MMKEYSRSDLRKIVLDDIHSALVDGSAIESNKLIPVAVVTGATSGIGREIAHTLARRGYAVLGLGKALRESSRELAENGILVLECDLADIDKSFEIMRKLLRIADVRILVNCAGVAYYGLHENLSPTQISEIVNVNLLAPMVLTSLVLRAFKEKDGTHIINISSVTSSKPSPHAAAYGATKAGLSAFSGSIWEEARKHGVRVTDICPDMTDTRLYRNADFGVDDDEQAYLLPSDVCDALEAALDMRKGVNVNTIKLMPRYNRIKRKPNPLS